jgi:hypothetical protein
LFTGAYNKEEFSTYFKTFRMRLKENKEITEPVVLSLDYSSHTISVMYDPVADIWRILDVNHMPSKPEELKKHIFSGDIDISEKIAADLFSKEGNTIFQTRISTTKDAEEIVNPAIDAWKPLRSKQKSMSIKKLGMEVQLSI